MACFFFLNLAFVKRYSEIIAKKDKPGVSIAGRAYQSHHGNDMKLFGLCSGFASIIIFALYAQSEKSALLYLHSDRLFVICPILLYWILRTWMIAISGKMHDDPVVFALKDPASYGIAALIFILAFLAAM